MLLVPPGLFPGVVKLVYDYNSFGTDEKEFHSIL